MNRLIICLAAVFVASIGLAQEKVQLKDQKDKISYTIGMEIGTSFKKQKLDLNTDVVFAGIKDAIGGKEPVLTKEEREKTMEAFSKEMTEKQATASKEAAQKNSAAGEKFLAENKKKEGVKTTPSGLQYKVLKEGAGAAPKETDTVETNYRGTLIDGTEFDSSYKRGKPAEFPVNRVIKGWTEALQMMKPGSKYELYVPANLAYGERGAGQEIGPNSTLIFEVELISVKAPEAAAPASSPGAKSEVKPAAKPEVKASATPEAKK